ncbi:D-2-hydroxyglutarate dehydrogenase, mitochondrial [Smittium mucronatum]|uniref:D-2-hydroxyglutarate dehydrogenase, mitochondrial n=1 Tax=Smittium mucronatum TaxID=133383 RepID=A0A1R0H0N1_9FUNG|nr:D-2-hydroxyglutarate dehydrogenase, mitochondrial [Smittium mucronatum]
MNRIRNLDLDSNVLVCDAGCILQDLDNHLDHCHIGGNVSTNAGGIRYLRYGSLHGSVLGLEVVLADGTVLNNLSTLRKDSTGYDIKQIFIGAEGTLGVVTGVSIVVPQKPKSMEFSLFSHSMADPLSLEFDYYILIEIGGSNSAHDEQKFENLFNDLQDSGTIGDGILLQGGKAEKMWHLRESMIYSHNKFGQTLTFDISIPVAYMEDAVLEMRRKFADLEINRRFSSSPDAPHLRYVTGFGHLGDGNLHLNVVVDRYNAETTHIFETSIFEYAAGHHGSISAEHGLGSIKPEFLHFSKSPEMVAAMHKIKHAFDPNGILNPYKVLPTEQ